MHKNDQTHKSIVAGAVSGGVAALVVGFLFLGMNPGGSGGSNFFDNLYSSVLNYEMPGFSMMGGKRSENYLSQEELVIQAVEKAKPAVVSVIITKDVPILEQYYEEYENPFGDVFGSDPFFNFQIPKYRENGTEKKEIGGGSGFIVSEDGYIVTNKHVVSDEEAEYTVFSNDGTEYTAEAIARDPINDIAVLKIDAKDLPYLEFANSDKLRVGQSVIAIGNPLLEFTNSVSVGVVSGLGRSIVASSGFGQSEQLTGVIQTDAAINPGNSGGPLLNLKGEVIGVNVAVASAENIGFSLPGNMVSKVFDSVKEHGKIIRPFLGVRYVQINERLKEANSLEVDYGVLIIRGETLEELAVIPGSPADKAGLLENDIILEVDGKKLDADTSLAQIIANKNVGDKLELKVLSKGKEKEVTVKLEEVPEK